MAGRDSIRSSMQSRRVLGALAVLALVWIGVYWATPPAPQPVAAITFENRAADPTPARRDIAPPPPVIASDPPPDFEPVVQPVSVSDASPEPAVIPPSFRDRVVRSGETMETIARAEFGDASMWTVIASANPRVDPMKMRAGMTLRIPLDPTNIQGKPNPAIAESTVTPETTSTESARIEYIVRSGDTLGGIARTYYNSAAKWRIILDANRDILSRPEQLRPGMKLVIPPAPSGD
jgi:nucleoid-associated protein YgaU